MLIFPGVFFLIFPIELKWLSIQELFSSVFSMDDILLSVFTAWEQKKNNLKENVLELRLLLKPTTLKL